MWGLRESDWELVMGSLLSCLFSPMSEVVIAVMKRAWLEGGDKRQGGPERGQSRSGGLGKAPKADTRLTPCVLPLLTSLILGTTPL